MILSDEIDQRGAKVSFRFDRKVVGHQAGAAGKNETEPLRTSDVEKSGRTFGFSWSDTIQGARV